MIIHIIKLIDEIKTLCERKLKKGKKLFFYLIHYFLLKIINIGPLSVI